MRLRALPLLLSAASLSGAAWAGDCAPGVDCAATASTPGAVSPVPAAASAADPATVSDDPKHLGPHCSYNTSALIRQVLRKGDPWRFVGPLVRADDLAHDVAVPYVVDDGARVLANEVLDAVVATLPAATAPVTAQGRFLELHGVRYVVLTSASPSSP